MPLILPFPETNANDFFFIRDRSLISVCLMQSHKIMNDGINFLQWMQYPDVFVKYRAVISLKKPINWLQVAKGFTAL